MNELRTLLALELRSLYGINKFLHTKDKKEKNRYKMLMGAWVMVIAVGFLYVGGLVYGLCFLGLGEIVPAYLAVISSLLILAFGVFTAGNRIFGQQGYDLVGSMPIQTHNLVLSRFLSLYVEDLFFTLMILLPGTVVYGFCRNPGVGFYLVAAVGVLLIPVIPLVISTLLGTVMMAISSRMKNKSLVQTLWMVLLVVGVLVGSFSMESIAENMTQEAITQLAQNAGAVLEQIYPPAVWLGSAMVSLDIGSLLLFAGVSVSVMAVAIFVTSKVFHNTVRGFMNFTAKHNYTIGKMASRGLLKALYLREVKRYFSSSIYVTNTIIGPIMGMIMAIALCVSGLETVQAAFPMDINGLLPYVFAGVFCTMTTTCTSISMEGKQFWVVKSLPIPTKTLLDSKLLLNLTLMIPCYIVSEIALIIAVRPGFLDLLWLVLIPAGTILFSVVFGITVNLKFHSFDWEKEETVVKQSLPAALGGFAGFFLAIILGVVQFAVPGQYAPMTAAVICLLVFGVTALLYRKNNQAVLCRL